MPLIKSAIKKMHQDRARTKVNQARRSVMKKAIKVANASATSENLSKAFSVLDKLAKKGLIHKNKAARAKSALAKMAGKTPEVKVEKAPKKAVKASTKTKAKAK